MGACFKGGRLRPIVMEEPVPQYMFRGSVLETAREGPLEINRDGRPRWPTQKTQWEEHEGERREGPPNSHEVRVAHKRVELARPAEPKGASPKVGEIGPIKESITEGCSGEGHQNDRVAKEREDKGRQGDSKGLSPSRVVRGHPGGSKIEATTGDKQGPPMRSKGGAPWGGFIGSAQEIQEEAYI
ncbi:hypothetical protein V9T40_000178 [Parthenolecanium corni]|uniref:Uncharacterized protein n=1 Tax=Parthenolecanium corni TaxID=536013 RepID=A0AAN9TCF8_9HEMI